MKSPPSLPLRAALLRESPHQTAARRRYRPVSSAACPHQSGMAIGVVIIALFLLVLAGVAATLSSRDTAYSANVQRIAKLVLAQSDLIRQQIVSCALNYPNGNNGQANAFDPVYPAQTASTNLSEISCPGAPGQPNLWTGSGGVYAPTPPSGCGWFYYNDKTRTGLPPLEYEIYCTGADNIAALALVNAQTSGDSSFYSNYATNDTLMFSLHQ